MPGQNFCDKNSTSHSRGRRQSSTYTCMRWLDGEVMEPSPASCRSYVSTPKKIKKNLAPRKKIVECTSTRRGYTHMIMMYNHMLLLLKYMSTHQLIQVNSFWAASFSLERQYLIKTCTRTLEHANHSIILTVSLSQSCQRKQPSCRHVQGNKINISLQLPKMRTTFFTSHICLYKLADQ